MQKKVTETAVLETETETESKRVAEGLQSKVVVFFKERLQVI